VPNRILKESICVSDSIDGLNWFEEVLFYRLIVNCDDYGRFDGRTAVIKNRLFPLKDNLTLATVKSAIHKLASAGLVITYECMGKPYLYLPTWTTHQTVRAKRSKYPAPEDGVQSSESNCKQMNADASKPTQENADVPEIQSNPIRESKSESESKRAGARDSETPDGFDAFWSAYPHKVGKQAAHKAWDKLSPSKALTATILQAVERQKSFSQWTRDGGRYIPNPSTWLNQGRWEDEDTRGNETNGNGSAGAASAAGAAESGRRFKSALDDVDGA